MFVEPQIRNNEHGLAQSFSWRSFVRQSQFFQLVQAGCAIPNVLKDGVRPDGSWFLCQRCERRPARTTNTFGIGVVLMHRTVKCGDQIVKLFLAAHDKPLS
jgi:hypothetical protein